MDGVTASVDYATEKASVQYVGTFQPGQLVATVERAGYSAELANPSALRAGVGAAVGVEQGHTAVLRQRLLVSMVLTVPSLVLAMFPPCSSLTGSGCRSRWPRRSWCGVRCLFTRRRRPTCGTAAPLWTR